MYFKIILLALFTVMIFSCSNEPFAKFANGYEINYDAGSYFALMDTNSTIHISRDIVKYGSNSDFIVAIQKPVYEIQDKLREEYRPLKFDVKKTLVRQSKLYYYWIVEIHTDKVHGPMSLEEFAIKCKELGVPRDIKLIKLSDN